MFLSQLDLANFRSCAATSVHFRSDLTILAGENNSGKSNVVDALRLITKPTDDRRTRFADESDVTRGTDSNGFAIKATFAGLSAAQAGLLFPALASLEASEATFTLRYTAPETGQRRGQVAISAGKDEGADPEPAARDRIRHVYLPALRDAQRVLATGQSTRIAFILKHLTQDKNTIVEFETKAKDALNAIEQHDVVINAEKAIRPGLFDLTRGVTQQDLSIRFADAELESLARTLRFKLGDFGVEPADLAESGLGYANLLYMAAVIVELQRAKDADLTLFLVEEPEAHLHPQLQAATLDYLRRQAVDSGKGAPGHPEGRIQVIATTHSPHMTAAVPIRHVTVLRKTQPKDAPTATVEVCIDKLGLPEKALAKIDRYLDVTRSSLLFAKRVLLVEGIAEALLLPAIARRVLKPDGVATAEEVKQRREQLARFIAAPIVPIDGVDFEPYILLLLTARDGYRIAERVVVVTDDDPEVCGDRKQKLESVASAAGAGDRLFVRVGSPTLEPELLGAGNEPILKAAFIETHPNSEQDWGEIDVAKPETLSVLLKRKRTRKGDFAQHLAQRIADGEAFNPPNYLKAAIEDLVA